MLELITSIWAFIYAAILMTILLDVNPFQLPKVKKLVYFLGMLIIAAVSTLILIFYGIDNFGKYYLFFAQIPGIIGFIFVCRHSFIKIVFVLLTIIFLMMPYTLTAIICNEVLRLPVWGTLTVVALMCAAVILFVKRYVSSNFIYVLDNFSTKSMLKFCIVPVIYNLIIYYVDGYTINLNTIYIRSFLFVSMLAVYLVLTDLFRQTREMKILQSEKDLIRLQLDASAKYLEELKRTQEQAVIYRHDMRHHFSLLKGYLADKEFDKAESYLAQTQAGIEAVTPRCYCENNAANLILSAFASKAQASGTELFVSANLPLEISLPETELCALLANSLENAVAAAAKVPELLRRKVSVVCKISDDKLLLQVSNPYTGTILMHENLPQASSEGHGYGIRSMASITEKRQGCFSCEADGSTFYLRIIIPLA